MGDRNHQPDGPELHDQDELGEEHGDRGATLVEYVLMISLIALVCILALGYFQDETSQSFSNSASHLQTAGM